MQNYLKVFKKLITSIIDENVVIGGTASLISHGLNMSRSPNDLDIIIYNITADQRRAINILSVLAINNTNNDNYPIESITQFKFKKENLYLNIIIENKECPVDLLYIKFEDIYLKIQNINYGINAKMSFKDKAGNHRYKDLIDIIDLKNSNFNIK